MFAEGTKVRILKTGSSRTGAVGIVTVRTGKGAGSPSKYILVNFPGAEDRKDFGNYLASDLAVVE